MIIYIKIVFGIFWSKFLHITLWSFKGRPADMPVGNTSELWGCNCSNFVAIESLRNTWQTWPPASWHYTDNPQGKVRGQVQAQGWPSSESWVCAAAVLPELAFITPVTFFLQSHGAMLLYMKDWATFETIKRQEIHTYYSWTIKTYRLQSFLKRKVAPKKDLLVSNLYDLLSSEENKRY